MNARITTTCIFVLGLVGARAVAACDTTPPCAPPDVSVETQSTSACVSWLGWQVADDGCGPSPHPAKRYEIRMSQSPITDWTTLPIAANGLVIPSGDQQHMFNSLQCSTTYYFVLFFFDAADNRSDPTYRSGTTQACGGPQGFCDNYDNDNHTEDLVPPCAPTDPTIEVGTHTAYLEWNNDSSGDDGCSGLPSKWEIRQSTSPISSSNWGSAQVVCRSTVFGSSLQGRNITGLSCNTTYYWVLFFFDDMGNRSDGVYRSATTLSCNQSLEVTGENDPGLPCCSPNSP